MAALAGVLVPGQEMANRFTIDLARELGELPPYTPFATGGLSSDNWVPTEPAFTRSHDIWEKMQESHKRSSAQPMSFRLFVLTYMRCAFAGDIAGAWQDCGGLAAQLTHLGALLSTAATENSMAAMAYDRSIRVAIETNTRKRMDADQSPKCIKMSTVEHGATKRVALRELGAESSEMKTAKTTVKLTAKGDPSRRRVKGEGKGKPQKGKGEQSPWRNGQRKGKGRRKTTGWDAGPNNWSSDWSYNRGNKNKDR